MHSRHGEDLENPCDTKGNFVTMASRSILTSAAILGAFVLVLSAGPLRAEDESYSLTIKDHRFTPDVVEIPSGKKVKIIVHNQDSTAEEFDSYDLNREKVVPGGSEGVVLIGPLDPGTYEFIGEYNADTAKGKVVVK